MVQLYRSFTKALTPLVRLHMLLRRWKGKEDASVAFAERWGVYEHRHRDFGEKNAVWIHAASVGESVSIALPLIHKIVSTWGTTLPVVLSVGTVGAKNAASKRLPPSCKCIYAPVDLPGAVDAFFDFWEPSAAIFTESELWPNLIFTAHERGVPVALVNGKISEKSFYAWNKWAGGRFLVNEMLSNFHSVHCQTEEDRVRFLRLGAKSLNTHVFPSLKLMQQSKEDLVFDVERRVIGNIFDALQIKVCWVAGSTYAEEESLALYVHKLCTVHGIGNSLTIIAPRQIERAQRDVLKKAEFACREKVNIILWSECLNNFEGIKKTLSPERSTVLIVDTLGDLVLFYEYADVALVGGSLVANGVGGHNVAEAALRGCHTFVGKYLEDRASVIDPLVSNGSMVSILKGETLIECANDIFDTIRDHHMRGDPRTRSSPVRFEPSIADSVLNDLARTGVIANRV
jgi:3-deoxy-D-manno-octulosonic-acid transferase|eukprot:Stramenopile-MAST_4_protein_704